MTKCLERKQEFQVSASLVKTGSTLTPKMGEEAFRCSSCQYQFPYHADDCPYNMNNQK